MLQETPNPCGTEHIGAYIDARRHARDQRNNSGTGNVSSSLSVARLVGEIGPATAVLGLEEVWYRVHENSELTLTGNRWAGQQFRVVEISPEAVRLESVPGGRSWILY
jgi:hypothetical protein